MKVIVRPLTSDLWPAFEDLFGRNGACNGCWCMFWRVGAAYRKTPRNALPWLDRAWRLKRVDDVPVWSLSCFYVRIGFRRRRHIGADLSGVESREAREGARARSLSIGWGQDLQHVIHWLCHDVHTRRIWHGRPSCAAASDHAS